MHNIQVVSAHLAAAWIGFLCGIVSGAVLGFFFHRDDWLGGYSSYPRRLIRLGHISFFGLGLLNALFALTAALVPMPEMTVHLASIGLLTGAITMPICCFLAAWRKSFRCLFPIPVGSLLAGTLITAINFIR
jgi:hypothetical protein